mmetsp:Transcript_62606/g.146927  ORF Transcript_62606/g.146927 Transcript_62606/m.146927 type:complete len:358 (+) Transcript_62606:111-1184(+)
MAGDTFVWHAEYTLLVVVGVILFGLCTGLCGFAWRNRHDFWLLLPALPDTFKLRVVGDHSVEQATEHDRIIFERAEKKRLKREGLREAAEADEGSDEGPPTVGPHVEEGRRAGNRSRTGSKSSTAATDSQTSQAFARPKGRKSSRVSEPGPGHGHHEGDMVVHSIRGSSLPPNARKTSRVSPLDIGDGADPLDLTDSSQMAALVANQRKHAERGRRHSVSTTTAADILGHGHGHGHLSSPSPTGGSLPLRGFHRPPPPSGAWKGTLRENHQERTNKYDIRFLPDNQLTGSTEGRDGFGQISGTFDPSSKKITWVERHPWGTVKATGHVFYSHHIAQITGSFETSDGGKGKLELSPGS